ncbi:MAG: thioredoxin domain-containing protein [Myxococcota bacterium]|nr:thioredoxin domain-containing protein [Myxococcota bacterium]
MNKLLRVCSLFAMTALVISGCELASKKDAKKADGKAAATAAKTDKNAKKGTDKAAPTGDSPIIPVGSSFSKGPANAPITIIEFSEFQCPFCSRVNPTLKQVQKEYGDKVRIVFKHNPLSFHKDAPLAAQASIAAGNQGKFWEMHDKLFENQRKLKAADIDGYAKAIGLDMTKFKADLNAPKTKAMVKADQALASKVGARGTPNFFINGKQLSGAQPFPRFKTAIDAELKATEAALKGGTDAKALYAARVKNNYKEPTKRPGKKGQPAADTKTVYKVPAGDSFAQGPKDALVTIIEFSEFQCPFCKRVLPTMDKIKKEYGDKVRIVFKHNPLPFHKEAPYASKAALAAGMQGKFWPMHDKLFENQRKLKKDQVDGYAKELGLDMAKYEADIKSPAVQKHITTDQAIARQFGARGTPNFFVNGRKITGARPFPSFKTIIDEEIKKAEALIKAGTPKAEVYAKLTAKGKTKAAPPAPRGGAKADDKTVYKMPVSTKDYAKGPADALVTIVEFSEYQCPFCTRVLPTLDQVTKKYGKDVRIIFKNNPLPFHKDAPLAAQAGIAAGKQGKFWPMHDVLFKNQKKLKAADIEGYAKGLGLDMAKFNADLNSADVKAQVKADMDVARQFGARGTPNFFINGRKLVGAQPLASFTKVIDEELKKAKALVAKGTPRNQVYAALTKNGATKAAAPAPRKAPPQDTKVYDVPVDATDTIKGNKNAKITIVEFSEFQCPFCSRVNPTLAKIQKEYGDKVRIVFKHNPLSFHKDAPLAAAAAEAAGKQGKFWEMHDLLFKNQRALKRNNLDGYAKELGLDMTKFAADIESPAIKKKIANHQAQAQALKARGTPHFFVNGRRLRGAQPFPRFKALIDEMLKK